jgi:Predicted phosphatase homologous to the C-terminal domain of histone macroH2A1
MNDLKKVRFIFVCPNEEYVHAMRQVFSGMPNWRFETGVFENVTGYDTLVSAGNSYGIMDGGLDLAVRDYLGMGTQLKVQQAIGEQFCGVLPVGSAVTVATKNVKFKKLIYAPTMRVPMDITDTNFVFYAALAAFGAVARDSGKIKGVVIPAFGALTGRVRAVHMSKQILAAWKQATTSYVFRSWSAVNHLEYSINPKGF